MFIISLVSIEEISPIVSLISVNSCLFFSLSIDSVVASVVSVRLLLIG